MAEYARGGRVDPSTPEQLIDIALYGCAYTDQRGRRVDPRDVVHRPGAGPLEPPMVISLSDADLARQDVERERHYLHSIARGHLHSTAMGSAEARHRLDAFDRVHRG